MTCSTLDIRETTGCLSLASRRAARAITRNFDRELRAHGVRATQFSLLSALELKGPQSIGALADLLGIERTTLTRNLALVEQRRLVEIEPGDDARTRIAAITSQGRATLGDSLPTWRKVQSELTHAIGKEAAIGLRRLAGGPSAVGLADKPMQGARSTFEQPKENDHG